MSNNEVVDVVVCGAGIAGLLIASELSRDLKVVVVEQNAEIPRDKFWISNASCFEANPDLRSCSKFAFDSMDIIAHDGTSVRIHGHYPYWDTNELVELLSSRVIKNDGKILSGHRIYNWFTSGERAVVFANRRRISAALVVDCMGMRSPIVDATRAARVIGYYYIYGKRLQARTTFNPIALYNASISSRPRFFEAFCGQDGSADAILILPARSLQSSIDLERDFEFLVTHSHLSECFSQESDPNIEFRGIIPAGILRKRQLERLYFYGESSFIGPAASATTFTRLLLNYRQVASHLRSFVVRSTRFTKDTRVNQLYTKLGFCDRFHRAIFKELLSASSAEFRDRVVSLKSLSNETLNKFIFGELSASDFFNLETARSLLKTRQGRKLLRLAITSQIVTW